MRYFYRAVGQNNKAIEGFLEAKDPQEAARYLRKQQLIPVKISTTEQKSLLSFIPFFKRSSTKDLLFFTRQLASMLTSGLTLMQSLTIMRTQLRNSSMADTIRGVIADVENGKSFSAAIEEYPSVFPPIYIALIRTAETSGLLDKVLLRLADTLEKKDQLQRTIRGALLYPLIVLVMIMIVMGIMMIFVIPQLSTLYSDFNQTLPLPTLIVIGLSHFTINFWPIVLGGMIFTIVFSQRWYHSTSGRRIIDIYTLKLPVLGRLVAQTMMAEFTRTLSVLVGSGSLVVDSLMRSADVVGNVVYRDAIILVSQRVEKGIMIGDAMEASPYFPPLVIEMVKVGEQTGKLDEGLLRASEYFEREVDETVKNLTTLMEPIIMVVLGFAVGFLIIAIISPIYGLISSIQ